MHLDPIQQDNCQRVKLQRTAGLVSVGTTALRCVRRSHRKQQQQRQIVAISRTNNPPPTAITITRHVYPAEGIQHGRQSGSPPRGGRGVAFRVAK